MNIFESIHTFLQNLSGFVWGGSWGDAQVIPYGIGLLAVLLVGTGLFMMIRLGGRPLTRFVPALREVWAGRKSQGDEGAITPWQALSTALSGQVGTGNLAGVATALAFGGPGAIFWMWITAILGMALAFSESSLAVKYRETDEYGRINGGPMYYIKNALGKKWTWLAVLFCIGTLFSAAVTGSMIQVNSITEAARELSANTFHFELEKWIVGIIIAGLVFAVVIGGIKSIGSIAGKIVPVMAAGYVLVALIVLMINIDKVPAAFGEIFSSAFGYREAAGGVAGYGMMQAIRYGIARGLFSNEAGQGSAPIAHAAAQTKNPVFQGEIAMIGVFIDTMIICTMTALVILVVQGNFHRSPAVPVADACLSAGHIAIPNAADGSSLAKTDFFPTASQTDRDALLAKNGAQAQQLLMTCAGKAPDLVNPKALAAAYPKVFEAVSGKDYATLVSLADSSDTKPDLKDAAQRRLKEIETEVDKTMLTVKHAWETDADSAAITTRAYGAAFPGGQFVVPVALFFFAFTTIIGWTYYGEQAVTYLIGEWATHPFRYAWVLVVFAGSLADPNQLWLIGDLANASMAFPNLIALLALSGVVVAMHKKNSGDIEDKS